MIANTGHTWSEVGQEWDLPRLFAWTRTIGRLPPLQCMVGHYLGYKMPEAEQPELTMEEHAARLLSAFTG